MMVLVEECDLCHESGVEGFACRCDRETAPVDDDPEPTRYDEAGAGARNWHGIIARPFPVDDLRVGDPSAFPQGKLLTEKLAQLLPAELDKRKDEGAVMATVAVLIEVLSEKMGRVF